MKCKILQAVSATSGRYSVPSQILRPQDIQSHSLARVDGSGGLRKLSLSVVPLAHDGQSPPSAGELLPRAQSGRERLLLPSPRNHPRRTSTEEIEAVQLTRAQVDHNYARSAYTEQGLPLLRSGESKVLRRDGMQCNSNFQAILTTFPNHSLQMNKSLFSNTGTQDGTSHLARKIQNVLF